MIQKNITIILLLFNFYTLFSMDGIIEKKTDLYRACEKGNFEVVKYLLDDSKNMKIFINTGKQGAKFAPVHLAAGEGHTVIIEALHNAGFSLDHQSVYETTPLHLAVDGEHEYVVLKLIELGAQLDLKDKVGDTCLYYAVGCGAQNIVEALVQNGASLFSKNKAGEMPLQQ